MELPVAGQEGSAITRSVRVVMIVAMAGLVLVDVVVVVPPVGAIVAVEPEGAVGAEVVGAAGPPTGLLGPEGATLPGGLEGPVLPDMIQRNVVMS